MTEVETRRERAVAAWLMAVYIAASLWFAATVYLTTLSIAGCGTSCNFDLQSWTVNTFLLIDLLLAAATATVYIRRRRSGLTAWWIPAGGIAFIGLAALIALLLSRVALGN